MNNIPAKALFLKVGHKLYQVASYQQASEMFCRARDAADCGASEICSQPIVDEAGQDIAYVSYNGRVWPGSAKNWKPDAIPLYDNRG